MFLAVECYMFIFKNMKLESVVRHYKPQYLKLCFTIFLLILLGGGYGIIIKKISNF